MPFDQIPLPLAVHEPLLKVLDLPVAAVNTLLPWQWKGIDVWSSKRQPEHESVWRTLLVHLRVAVPVYVLLFYVPNVIAALVRRRKRG